MPKVLRIDCSPRGPAAHSRRMTAELMARLEQLHPALEVVARDLAEAPPTPIDAGFAAAMREHQTAASAAAAPALALSERLIGELEATDMLVIGLPMHNYTIPANLKAWVDQVVRFGRTFESTPDGKVGKLRDRPTFVIVAAGGYFTPPRARQPDFLTPYLGSILATLGIRDVTVFPLEGLNRGEAAATEAYQRVRDQFARRLPSAGAAAG